jgi:hypothetical protein
VRQSRYRGITTSLPPAISPGGTGNETDFTQYFQFASKESAIMNKPLLILAALLIASPAFSGESRMHTTRDSGSYEATLRQAGIPLAGGQAWTVHTSTLAARKSSRPAAAMVAAAPQSTRAN